MSHVESRRPGPLLDVSRIAYALRRAGQFDVKLSQPFHGRS